jgi:hypothetical protein
VGPAEVDHRHFPLHDGHAVHRNAAANRKEKGNNDPAQWTIATRPKSDNSRCWARGSGRWNRLRIAGWWVELTPPTTPSKAQGNTVNEVGDPSVRQAGWLLLTYNGSMEWSADIHRHSCHRSFGKWAPRPPCL